MGLGAFLTKALQLKITKLFTTVLSIITSTLVQGKKKKGRNLFPYSSRTNRTRTFPKMLLNFFLFQDEWTHIVSSQFIVLVMGAIANRKRFRAPASAVGNFGNMQVLYINFIHNFWVLLLDFKINQTVFLLLLFRQEWSNCKVAQQGKDTQERQQSQPF